MPDQFLKSIFRRNMAVMSLPPEHFLPILDRLPDRFSLNQLAEAIDATRRDQQASGFLEEIADTLISLTRANYQLRLPHSPPIFREVEIVIFPFSDIESHGIEDLRLVRFTEDDGRHTYYGTFTAFDGGRAFPKLLEYPGGDTININLITGECAKNKGMALFPRRIRGKYAMISRIDNENLYYMESDDILAWEDRAAHPGAEICLAGDPDRQLRLAHRDRPGLAALDARRWTDARVLHRRDLARKG